MAMLTEDSYLVSQAVTNAAGQLDSLQSGVGNITQEFPALHERLDRLMLAVDEIRAASTSKSAIQALHTDTVGLQRTLISSPSAFRSICDSIDLDAAPKQQISFQNLCSCSIRQTHKAMFLRQGASRVSTRTTEASLHSETCPYWNPSQSTKKTMFCVSYISLLLKRSIQANLEIGLGAGGYSISPSLTFRRIVPRNSAAFALISLESLVYLRQNEDDYLAGLSRRIFKLFRDGEASPYDQDEYGDNLLHVGISIFGISCNRLLIDRIVAFSPYFNHRSSK